MKVVSEGTMVEGAESDTHASGDVASSLTMVPEASDEEGLVGA